MMMEELLRIGHRFRLDKGNSKVFSPSLHIIF
jgi:hypothetical protein